MSFKLSKTSKKRLKGVDQNLLLVVGEAIKITEMDFGVSCGLRTEKNNASWLPPANRKR